MHNLQQKGNTVSICVQVMAAAKDLQHCVYLSAACAETFVNGGGASSVIHYMRSCNRFSANTHQSQTFCTCMPHRQI